MMQEINSYIAEIDKIYRTGKATEHSYRPALQNLLEKITSGLTITNEPKHIACGAPDYIVTHDNIPLGYIEAKDIKVGISNKANKAQFDRYRQSLGNLIITDYLTFQLFIEGNLATSVTIAQEKSSGIIPDKKHYETFLEIFNLFTHYEGKTINQSQDLARMMAAKAKLLAEVIRNALTNKDKHSLAEDGYTDSNDTLFGQFEGFRQILIQNLSVSSFADMYAQTLAYGLFAARLNQRDPAPAEQQPFNRVIAANLIPQSNPFLRKFFQYIAGFDLDSRILWIVDALANIFNSVSVEDIRKEFGKRNQDPYIHFYETFLTEYDPALKESRGVYYTPLPIVKFIVRAVDDILKNEFSLKQGLADNSKIKLPVKSTDKQGNQVITGEREFHKVQILDPAAGTGTFLAEIIDNIYSGFMSKGMWDSYCTDHLIPRLNGFEILMASYAMAHFKLDMTLKETGFISNVNSRLQVYLTNTLEEAENVASNFPMVKWLTDEAKEANSIKKDTPVMVILGNPPYSGESSNFTREDFLECYKKEPGGKEKLKEKNPKWINDDYVKFIRFSQNLIEKYGDGVLAFVNNHSFLDNPTFRGMRWNLLNSFDKIYILDLHGNSKKKETAPDGGKDVNIFDIQQGVSINIFIKTGKKKKDDLGIVFHADIYGERIKKYTILQEKTIDTIKWEKLEPVTPYYFFMHKDFSSNEEYRQGFDVQELFSVQSNGLFTARDNFTIHFTKQQAVNVINEFLLLDNESARNRFGLGEDVRDWSVNGARNDLTKTPNFNNIVKINYRPFDYRYTYYTGNTKGYHCMPRGKFMRHFIKGKNIGLIIGRQGQAVGSMGWNLLSLTSNITDLNIYYRGGGMIFPLYLYPFDDSSERRPNLNADIIKAIEAKIGLTFTEEKTDDKKTFAPIDILDYIYAVLHSLIYREKYKEFLRIDFPRIPYPKDADQFQKLLSFGEILRKLHLLENATASNQFALFPVKGSNNIENLTYKEENIWINKEQYFEAVPKEVWSFYIGGYQPAQKWLKDRKGVTLNFDEIEHYQKIINVLHLTIEIQRHIDESRLVALFLQ